MTSNNASLLTNQVNITTVQYNQLARYNLHYFDFEVDYRKSFRNVISHSATVLFRITPTRTIIFDIPLLLSLSLIIQLCTDINECKPLIANCTQQCINTPGSYNCSCDQYFTTDPSDWRNCVGRSHLSGTF